MGVLLPGTKTSAEFIVQNDSNQSWKVSFIGTTCACTVTEISKGAKFDPGTETVVTISYTAPAVESDERRLITIKFEEEDAPFLKLFVNAKIRKEVSVRPSNIVNDVYLGSEIPAEIVVVENHTNKKWKNLCVGENPAWLDSQVRELSNSDEFQSFLLELRFLENQLKFGKNQHSVKLDGVCEDGSKIGVPSVLVSSSIRSALVCRPASIFLGHVNVGQQLKKTILLKILDEEKELSWDELSFEFQSKAHLSNTFSETPDKRKLVFLEFSTPIIPGNWKDELLIKYDGKILNRLPVLGRVEAN
ncbi:MAG: DUF1573 domain-containing protein [Planctomycetota bacterium]